MFIIWANLVRYPRMYWTPPPPETEDEELEDTSLIQFLQIPDLITFLALLAGSIVLPLKMDGHVHWPWQNVFIPFYISFLAPALALLILFPMIGWKPFRYGMLKPFNQWTWWLEFLTYSICGPLWLYLCSLHLDGKDARVDVPWKEVFIPLYVMNGCSTIAHLLTGECIEFMRDVFITLPFSILLQLKLSAPAVDGPGVTSWWQVMAPIFVADGFFCIYNATRPNPRVNRVLIFFGSLIILIPLIMFQYTFCQKLEWVTSNNTKSGPNFSKAARDWQWEEIFSPVYTVEGLMFCPICYIICCNLSYNARQKWRAKQRADYERVREQEEEQIEHDRTSAEIMADQIRRIEHNIDNAADRAVIRAERAAGRVIKSHGKAIAHEASKHV
eukprot:comp24584_c0_seq1/m.60508 comp24584_c0_seq1/g.60508  ORF comp24584_c0_seq1/g.60508 comp24584_c0_seq1/m.60508 type:complete len:386 (+) comp24584_c0_seq1:71-1228(+)